MTGFRRTATCACALATSGNCIASYLRSLWLGVGATLGAAPRAAGLGGVQAYTAQHRYRRQSKRREFGTRFFVFTFQ